MLYGEDALVPRDEIAIISGIRIPCSGDVPAYVMGISPADLTAYRLVHCTQTGRDAITVVDRKRNRAVKIDIFTGVLPYDRELLGLRNRVIMKKQAATAQEHCRFFDRLGELITAFVRVNLGNFRVVGPFALPWQEFADKLSFMPWQQKLFHDSLRHAQPSPTLVEGLIGLELLNPKSNQTLIEQLRLDSTQEHGNNLVDPFSVLINDPTLKTETKVKEVIDRYIIPVLENDGGRLELLNFDAALGEVTVRFLGSCANCPSSLLSVETIVKPPLLNIPGVHHVIHRTYVKPKEVKQASALPAGMVPY